MRNTYRLQLLLCCWTAARYMGVIVSVYIIVVTDYADLKCPFYLTV